MKIKLRSLFVQAFVLSLAFWLYGCGSMYYMPTMQPVHLFSEKGQFTATGVLSATEDSEAGNIAEAQLGYAFSNHFALTAGGTKVDYAGNEGYMVESGVTYFLPIDEEKHTIIEVNGSVGYGRVFPGDYYLFMSAPNQYHTLAIKPVYRRAFIQPALGIRLKNVEIAGSARITALNVALPGRLPGYDQESWGQFPRIADGVYYMAEPAATLRIGLKNLKLHGQLAFALHLNQYKPLSYQQFNLSTGLSFRLPFE